MENNTVYNIAQDIGEVLYTEAALDAKCRELASAIDADYTGKELVLVGILKGSFMIMADLVRRTTIPLEIEFMAVSSYGSSSESSGVVRILKDLDTDIKGKHVLLVEDIIDSGLTLSWLLRNLATRNPRSLKVCTLLRKPDAVRADVDVTYVGFDIPNEFVVGYGLDYAERYRDLPYIGTLEPKVYENP